MPASFARIYKAVGFSSECWKWDLCHIWIPWRKHRRDTGTGSPLGYQAILCSFPKPRSCLLCLRVVFSKFLPRALASFVKTVHTRLRFERFSLNTKLKISWISNNWGMKCFQAPFHTYNPDSERNWSYPSLLVYPEHHGCWAEIHSWLVGSSFNVHMVNSQDLSLVNKVV